MGDIDIPVSDKIVGCEPKTIALLLIDDFALMSYASSSLIVPLTHWQAANSTFGVIYPLTGARPALPPAHNSPSTSLLGIRFIGTRSSFSPVAIR